MVNSQFFDKELHFLAMMDSHQIETGVTAAGPSRGVAFSRLPYTRQPRPRCGKIRCVVGCGGRSGPVRP